MTRKLKLAFTLLPVLLLAAPRAAFSQATTAGSLSGTITDPSEAVIPGATVTITKPDTGYTQTVTSSSAGGYIFPDLQAGQYTLRVSAKGFSVAEVAHVLVLTGRALSLNVTMKVGAATQTVEVSSAAQVLETTTNTLATTITPDAVQDLPLNGRDALPFAQLVSGAQSGGDQRFTTFDAEPNASINITVDGMNDNFQRYRTATTGFFDAAPLRLGAVDEITVSTNDNSADNGAEGATGVSVELKRGTNSFHGNAFWETQNSAFNANTFANNAQGIKKSPFHISDFGGGLGGPIWKSKLFFFGNYEQEYVPGNLTGYAPVLTTSAEAGNFTYTGTDGNQHTVNVLSVAASNGFPSTVNSLVQQQFSQINPTYGKALQQLTTTLPYQDALVWQYRWNYDQIYPTLRVDYQIKPNIEWHAAYDMEWRTYPGYQAYPGDPYTNSSFNSTYQTFTTGLEWTITPKVVNQLTAGLLNTQEEFNVGHSWNPFTPENDIIMDAPSFVNGSSALNPWIPNYYLPEPRNNPVRDIHDNLSWTRGEHTFTFGGDLRNSTDYDTGDADPPGNYLGLNSFDPALSMFNSANFPDMNFAEANNQDPSNAESLYATLTGRINDVYGYNYVNSATHQYKLLGVMKQPEAQTVGGFYFQDAWKMSPHLTLNYGFRWQFSGAIHNTNNTYTNPTFASLLGPSTQLFHPGQLNGVQNPQVSLRPAPYSGDMKEPAPNFGFNWNPDWTGGFLGKLAGGSNLVIRGGAAVTWYDEGWTTFEQATEYSNPGDTQLSYLNAGPTTGTPPGEFAAGSLSLGATPGLNTFPGTFSFPVPESDFTFGYQPFGTVDPNIRSPYIENWYFGLQRQFPSNTVVQVDYVGNHSIHMWMNYDLNEVNIFENGFLNEFKTAQANLASYEANNPNCGNAGTCSFEGTPGSLPILEQAFGSGGSGFTNQTNASYISTGQAGALAYTIADNPNWFCNLVGTGSGGSFTPCASLGYSGGTAYPVNIFQANPFASGEPILLLSDPGSESYNGLQVQVKHPTGHNLMLMANYAYSHAFTNRYIGDYYTSDEAINNFTTLRNKEISRAPSPYDQRQKFTVWTIYALPFVPSNRLVKEAAAGWKLSPIVTWQAGRNFKLLGGTNTFNYYAGSGQPDASDSGVVLNGITVKQLQKAVGYYPGPDAYTPRLLMNPKVFGSGTGQVAPEETPGQLGQFVYLHGPQIINTDFAVTKDFPIVENLHLDIQAEMLNVFNHPQWAVVDGYSGGTNNPAQYVNVQNSPAVPGAQTNPEGLGSGGSRDIQFRVQLQF
ncbi:MAG: TonB-dependent receptor [Acidobacteriaceae bacterium]